MDAGGELGDVGVLLSAWYRRAREGQMSHYAAATRCTAMGRWFGIPSALLSAAAGTTLFATLPDKALSVALQITAGLVALVAGALSALQTFLGLSERADKHLAAGATYGSIRREIEQLQVLPPPDDQLRPILDSIRTRLDNTSSGAPTVGDRVWRKAQADIEHTSRPEGFTQAYLAGRRGNSA